MADPTELTLVEKRPGPGGDRYCWRPFGESDHFTSQWWDRTPHHNSVPWFVQALLSGDEVARIQLKSGVHIDHYGGTPVIGAAVLEIAFFEVSAGHRLRGIGTAVIQAFTLQHPNRRLIAFSEGADKFWASLGWERFIHATEQDYYRPLFIQPQPVG